MIFKKTIQTVSVLTALCTASLSLAQEATEATETNVVIENFEGDDRTLMLGGQIDFNVDKSPWLVYLADGKLILENRTAPQSLHYNDIAWIKYPGSSALMSTENSVISVVVESQSTGRGGAGILFGSGKRGAYLMFSVDEEGRYHLFRKERRETRLVHSAVHPAILVGAPNELAFKVSGANIVFFANGTEVIQVPNTITGAYIRQVNGQSGVGLAAFGTGTFSFDSVEITQAN